MWRRRRQVLIAGALLRGPPILILDEATALSDPAGEQKFYFNARQ